MHNLGISGEGESSGQTANQGSSVKLADKTGVHVCVMVTLPLLKICCCLCMPTSNSTMSLTLTPLLISDVLSDSVEFRTFCLLPLSLHRTYQSLARDASYRLESVGRRRKAVGKQMQRRSVM